MKRAVPPILLTVAVLGIGWMMWQRLHGRPADDVLYGNVEIRQVDLAFNAFGTVQAMLRQEGDRVKTGDALAALDDETNRHALELAEARRDVARAQLDQLLAGSRIEDINEARGSLDMAKSTLANAELTFGRQQDLVRRDVTSRAAFDEARAALDSARGRVAQLEASLSRAVNGPRAEEIAAGRANLQAAEATVALARKQLAQTRLLAPSDGMVMTRVVEPGAVVLPTATIYSMAIEGEVWVRGFAPEPMLSRLAPGTEVSVTADGSDGVWRGRIGYVSPSAEFTPKTVETPELRSQLVYRLRVRIENPDDRLRQGMPVTIHLPLRG
jgi:HlyD family secretion protein